MLRKLCISVALGLFTISVLIKIDKNVHRLPNTFCVKQLVNVGSLAHLQVTKGLQSPSQEDMKLLRQVLRQRFTTYNKNPYFYTFVSEDQEYELKLFRRRAFGSYRWISRIPLSFNPYYDDYLSRQGDRDRLLLSCRHAFTVLKEETGCIYAHLSPTQSFPLEVSIVDKRGEEHRFNLDHFAFCIQKHASLLGARIAELMDEGALHLAGDVVSAAVSLIDRLRLKGVVQDPRTACQYLGIIDDRVVRVGVSQLVFYPVQEKASLPRHDTAALVTPLREWLAECYPDLLPYLESFCERS